MEGKTQINCSSGSVPSLYISARKMEEEKFQNESARHTYFMIHGPSVNFFLATFLSPIRINPPNAARRTDAQKLSRNEKIRRNPIRKPFRAGPLTAGWCHICQRFAVLLNTQGNRQKKRRQSEAEASHLWSPSDGALEKASRGGNKNEYSACVNKSSGINRI